MNRFVCILAAALTCSVASAQITNKVQSPTEKPTTRVTDCTSSGCHAAQKDHKVLHGPNSVGACDACHETVDPAKHTFELKRKGKELCEFCHIDKTGTEGPVVHKPVATGDCTGCHDPHGASNRKLLKKDTTPELCMQCHRDVLNGKHKHGPAASDCSVCHTPHTSTHEHLLVMDKQALCLNCHEDVAKTVTSYKHPHDPAKKDCLQCHSPHASDNEQVLRLPTVQLCAQCHQKTVDSAEHAKHTHGALTEGKACLNCHTPHGSEFDKQLVSDPIAACLKCHDKPIQVSADKVVKGVPEIADPKLHKHGAIEKGDCSGCHTVHGGPNDRLLQANYTNTFYLKFTDHDYELCFKCHNKEMVRTDIAEPQTRFRDGDRNLHALHVVSPNGGTQGRNCRSCHSIHASRFTQLINDTVPFGGWKMPINFQPTETGGSCSPGCHEPQKYDRVTPFKGLPLKAAAEGSPPSSSDGPATKPN